MKTKQAACLNPACQRKANVRGLCFTCYSSIAALVRHGRTSWEKLEKDGKALSPQRTGTRTTTRSWALSK